MAGGIEVHEEVNHFRRVVLLRRTAQFLGDTGELQALFVKELHIITAPALVFVNGGVRRELSGHIHYMSRRSSNSVHLFRCKRTVMPDGEAQEGIFMVHARL